MTIAPAAPRKPRSRASTPDLAYGAFDGDNSPAQRVLQFGSQPSVPSVQQPMRRHLTTTPVRVWWCARVCRG